MQERFTLDALFNVAWVCGMVPLAASPAACEAAAGGLPLADCLMGEWCIIRR